MIQNAQLSLIHIPLDQYQLYLPFILKLLFPPSPCDHADSWTRADLANRESWANQYAFLNVSVTPIECSVVCEKRKAQELFAPAISQMMQSSSPNSARFASISTEDFVVVSVEGGGIEAGQRVLELTSPLALAGM